VRRLAAIAAAVAVAAAGCGSGSSTGGDPDAALRATAAKLGSIRSGDLDFRFSIVPKGGDTEPVGWELKGPFALGGSGRPTQFRIDYTQRRGDREATVTVTSSGGKAYVAIGNEAYELPPAQARRLTQAGAALSGGKGLGELDIGGWLRDPELSAGDDVGGDATDRIRADVDVAAAARDLLALARRAGADSLGGPLSTADAKRLSDAVDHASVDVLTGTDDRLLRRLELQLDLGLAVPEPLRATLGTIVGAAVDMELTVSHPNEQMTIAAPPNPHPPSEYPG
jgi:hypothetical protein